MVGVSWHEAAAYAAWLTEQFSIADLQFEIVDPTGRNQQSKIKNQKSVIRLPTEAEWLRLAGGEKDGKKERYPVGYTGEQPRHRKRRWQILARANTYESGIGGTSPVNMYPLGESKPFELWDVAGNVWEWTDSWYDESQSARVVRGGSWYHLQRLARPSVRYGYYPASRTTLRFSPGLPH